MSKFKVGDNLRHKGNSDILTPYLFKIVELKKSSYFLNYKLKDMKDGRYFIINIDMVQNSFEQARVKNTLLSKKLYPEWEEDGEWLKRTT